MLNLNVSSFLQREFSVGVIFSVTTLCTVASQQEGLWSDSCCLQVLGHIPTVQRLAEWVTWLV